jgi:hypothetical protein
MIHVILVHTHAHTQSKVEEVPIFYSFEVVWE